MLNKHTIGIRLDDRTHRSVTYFTSFGGDTISKFVKRAIGYYVKQLCAKMDSEQLGKFNEYVEEK